MKNNIKLWIDDCRPAPEGYVWCKTVNEAKLIIQNIETLYSIEETAYLPSIALIDIDHDAGDYAKFGGDYINVLTWMENQGYNIPIHIHSMNVVGVQNMRAIIRRNGWTEVK